MATELELDLFKAYCYLVDCEVATLEYVRDLKSSAKSEVSRHEKITDDSIATLDVFWKKLGSPEIDEYNMVLRRYRSLE